MLKKKIDNALRDSLKKKDTLKISTLRLLLSCLKNARIEKMAELTDEEILAIIRRGVKERDEAVELYKKGGRQDLVDKEEAEKKILQEYLAYRQAGLPKEIPDEEIKKIVERVLKDFGENPNFGQAMGKVMVELKGCADGRKVAAIVSKSLKK